jgi:hypothetical protein
MVSHGIDFSTNPYTQVDWGMDYITKRYKTPCKALQFHDRKNWY